MERWQRTEEKFTDSWYVHRQLGDNAEPIEKLKRDYALVTKTLQKALGGDGDPEP